MAQPITVPRLGWSMEEGNFIEWLKHDGDEVRSGDPLFVLEGEKAAETIEALDAGVLRLTAASPAPGTIVQVGQVLGYIASADEAIEAIFPPANRSPASQPPEREPRSVPSTTRPIEATHSLRSVAVSPRARRVARELGVDLSMLVGSGRDGRIRERDVRGAGRAWGRFIPHSRTRRLIAARMVAGVTQAAPVTLITKVDAAGLVQGRQRLAPRPTFDDLMIVLTAATLRRHPLLQAQWRDEGLWLPDSIDIALAVDTEAGLLTPVVRAADSLTIEQVSNRTADLIEQARRGRIAAADLTGATFTISNLGMYGIDAFTPIITLPQCAVLGIGRITADGVTLSLTFDHRIIDGAPAARFLQDLGRAITRGKP